jgi:hypothetical protein
MATTFAGYLVYGATGALTATAAVFIPVYLLIFETKHTRHELRAALALADAQRDSHSTEAVPAAKDDVVRQLSTLADLHASGVLSAEEFTCAQAATDWRSRLATPTGPS